MYNLYLVTEPTEEPVTLAEAKEHLRIDSSTFEENVSQSISIAPALYASVASYTILGTGIDIGTYNSIVYLNTGENGTSGTIDVKIQESDNNTLFADWTNGTFTQVTTANDNTIFEKAYTGNKRYIRTAAKVEGGSCTFSTTVLKYDLNTTEDTYIENLIKVARKTVEKILNKSLITQTWEVLLDDWPETPFDLPFSPVQSISYITYTDSDQTVATVSTSVYRVDVKSKPARLNLGYSQVWPTTTLDTLNGICIRMVTGYGTASSVPIEYKQAIMMLVGHYYENREDTDPKKLNKIPNGVFDILGLDRIYTFI